MIYAVIDTNVIVSAYITKNQESATIKVVNAVLSGKILPILSSDILAEYDEVLWRAKFDIKAEWIDLLLAWMESVGIFPEISEYDEEMQDEDDRKFYEAALSVKDAFLVTGNLKHYPKSSKVVSPKKFIQMLEGWYH